jgi:tetratricopeptide (TPR) repeat protein
VDLSTRPAELLRTERFALCARELTEARARFTGEEAELADVWLARAELAQGELDRAMLAVLQWADVRPAAAIVAAQVAAGKRCVKLAGTYLAKAEALGADGWEIEWVRAQVHLAADDRDAALALCARAAEAAAADDEAVARVSVLAARTLYLRGEMDAALDKACLARPGTRARGTGLRVRSNVFAARKDRENSSAALRQVLDELPDSDHHAIDWLNYGFELAHGGHYEKAKATFLELALAMPDNGSARYAKSRAERIAKELAETGPDRPPSARPARKVLSFPTTAQKRNYCGPAVLELCLRALSIDVSQDEIAGVVKRETGTPMHEIVHFLRARSIAVRRIRADDRAIKQAIDLGLPVILQEEYSTTSHVAVVIGYDETLGVLVLQDPMGHQTSTRAFGWAEQAGQLYGCGGVLVLGRDGEATRALEVRADEAGLVDAAHLHEVDACSRRVRGADGELVGITPTEIVAITTRALAKDPSFRLALLRRFYAKRSLYLAGQVHRSVPLADVYDARTKFPKDEWPCQLLGVWHLDHARHADALAAYLDAHRRDPGDGNNLAQVGECKRRMGRLVDAEKYLLKALQNDADDGRAEWMLAEVYLRMVARLDERTEADDTEDPRAALTRALPVSDPERVLENLPHGRDELLRRAAYFNAVAREHEPKNTFHHERAGLIDVCRGRFAEARAHFEDARSLAPQRYFTLAGLAVVCRAEGDKKGAEDLYEELCRLYPKDREAWLLLVDFLVAEERAVDGARAAVRAIRGVPEQERARFLRRTWDALSALGENDETAARILELVQPFAGDSSLMWDVSALFLEERETGCAIQALRRALAAAPETSNVQGQLGRLLAEAIPTRLEGVALLERAIEAAPRWATPRRNLALRVVDEDPQRALDLVTPVLGEESMWTYEVESYALARLGRDAEAEKALRRAIAASGEERWRALKSIARWHTEPHRLDRATFIAERMWDEAIPEDSRLGVLSSAMWPFRIAGKADRFASEALEACKDGVPRALAWEVYWGFKKTNPTLARAAARVYTEKADDDDRPTWEVRTAQMDAKVGDPTAIDALLARTDDPALALKALCQLADALADLGRFDDAHRAASAAFARAPLDGWAACEYMDSLVRRGAHEEALAVARRLRAGKPYDHRGPEREASLLARTGKGAEALALAEAALLTTPTCDTAQLACAEALVVLGDVPRARLHAREARRLAWSPAPELLLTLAALDGAKGALEEVLGALRPRIAAYEPFYARLAALAADPG